MKGSSAVERGRGVGVHGTGVEAGSGRMFDGIAHRYDLLNRVLSLGLDRRWRKRAVAALGTRGGERVLDLATGTADVALEVVRQQPGAKVLGIDPSLRMLEIGRRKVAAAAATASIQLRPGEASSLPVADGAVDHAIVAFGLRNVPDRRQALQELARVVRADGRVAVLELIEPRAGVVGAPARFHVHQVVPRIGGWLSSAREYRYLERSIAAFPPPQEVAGEMTAVGLVDVEVTPMGCGAVCLFVGRREGR